MRDYTLEINHINVKAVTSVLALQEICVDMRDYTLEINHIAVKLVTSVLTK